MFYLIDITGQKTREEYLSVCKSIFLACFLLLLPVFSFSCDSSHPTSNEVETPEDEVEPEQLNENESAAYVGWSLSLITLLLTGIGYLEWSSYSYLKNGFSARDDFESTSLYGGTIKSDLNALKDSVNNLTPKLLRKMEGHQRAIGEVGHNARILEEQLTAFDVHIARLESENKRLKEGFLFANSSSILTAIISVINDLGGCNDATQLKRIVSSQLKQALELAQVTLMSADDLVKRPLQEVHAFCEVVERLATDNPSETNTVAEVMTDGYWIQGMGTDVPRVVRRAQVALWVKGDGPVKENLAHKGEKQISCHTSE